MSLQMSTAVTRLAENQPKRTDCVFQFAAKVDYYPASLTSWPVDETRSRDCAPIVAHAAGAGWPYIGAEIMTKTDYKRLSHHYRRYDYGRAMSAGTPRESYFARQQLAFSRLLPGSTRRATVIDEYGTTARAFFNRDDVELALKLS